MYLPMRMMKLQDPIVARRRKGDAINGWIIIDKPIEKTSAQVVNHVRRVLNAQKAGHAGTLDPLATGILPIALGEATKTISFAMDTLKDYQFEISWGEDRDTQDIENQGYMAVTHDGCTGKYRDALELLAERLNNDFL